MEAIHLLILIIGVGLGFYVQTVIGFAAALVALPIILYILNIQESVALLSIFFLIFGIILIYKNWKLIEKKTILEMLIGIIAGLLLGIYILKFGSPIILKKALGIFIIVFVGYLFIKEKKIKSFKKLGPLFGFIGGTFSGLFSTGGPPIVFYIYNKLDKSNIIRATIIGTLGITDFLRFPLLIFSGILTYDIFLISFYVLPFFFLSLYLGHKTHHRINENTFKNVLMIFLILSGISLIVR
jgi:uncharacterized membrane protein YfcA